MEQGNGNKVEDVSKQNVNESKVDVAKTNVNGTEKTTVSKEKKKGTGIKVVVCFAFVILILIIGILVGIIFFDRDGSNDNNKTNTTTNVSNQNSVVNNGNTTNIVNSTNNVTNKNDKYSQQELEKMALDYYEALTGYRPSKVTSKVNDDGTLAIQMYDLVQDHTSTSDWYTVDMKTAEGTNVLGDKINLKNKPERKISAVVDVKNEKVNVENAKYYMNVTGYDAQGNAVWTYKTKTDYIAQADLLEFLGVKGDIVYINEHAKIVALDKKTGKQLWENTDYVGGGDSKFTFDDEGNIYLSGSMGPDLLAINKDGKTMKLVKAIDENMYWPTSIKIEDKYVVVAFPTKDYAGDDTNNYVYFELDDIKNVNNKILNKEIVPEFKHQQIVGFEEIKMFELNSKGEVFIKFEPNSDLAKKYGDKDGKYKVTTGVKNIYAYSSGNGGYGSFIMVKQDGSMQVISSYELSVDKKLEAKDTKFKNVDYAIQVEGFDAYTYYAVFKDGKASIY